MVFYASVDGPLSARLHPVSVGVRAFRNSRLSLCHAASGPFVNTNQQRTPPFTIESVTLTTGLVDYYRMLELETTANQLEIKASYRRLQKKCHPDILGEEHGHEMSILLNDAYTVLSNTITRELYDIDLHGSRLEEELGFTNQPFSDWLPVTNPSAAHNTNPNESRALFVDEASCIGCKQCCFAAKDTFELDARWGRARVTKQWADCEDNLRTASECCPVTCIHWVQREDLPVLEHIMKNMKRVDVGIMQSATCQRGAQVDVFAAAENFRNKKREGRRARKSWTEAFMYSREQEEAMRRAAGAHTAGVHSVQRVMAWIRNRLWEACGYGLDRQPAVERRPRAWKNPSESPNSEGRQFRPTSPAAKHNEESDVESSVDQL